MPTSAETGWLPSDERRELGESLRRLLDVVVTTGADPAELRSAAGAIDELTARLTGQPSVRADMSVGAGSFRDHMSLVGGLSHPIAPQLRMAGTRDAAQGTVVVGPLFQGGPGLVHGGILALLIDHAMGCVAAGPDRPAMTARLDLRYRRPTPVGVPLTVSARVDRAEGRKLHLTAAIAVDGTVTVDADAIFLVLTQENLDAVFGAFRS